MLRTTTAFALVGVLFSACSFGPGNIQTRHSSDIETRKIKRIAVIPPAASVERKTRVPFTSAPPDSKPSEREAADLLAHQIYSTMAAQPGWQIVSESEIEEVGQTLGSLSDAARAQRLGELVYADAVLTAQVQRYRERVGNEVGAKTPASVAFVADLVDLRRGDIVWSGRFDETQKALSENIFAIGDISQRGIRWLSADQLMLEGVKKTVNQLHQVLVRSP
jgi:TolB-like protein